MKTSSIFFTSMIAAGLLASCTKDEAVAPVPVVEAAALEPVYSPASANNETRDLPCLDANAPLLGRIWKLQSLSGRRISLPVGATRPWLSFSADADHAVAGSGGCNELFATVTVDCEAIRFSSLGSTQIYCASTQGLEEFFFEALRKADGYAVNGGSFVLYEGLTEMAAFYSHNLPTVPSMEPSLVSEYNGTPPTIPDPDE